MKSHKLNKSNTCIAGWYDKNTTLFDDLINFHKNSKQKTKGVSYSLDTGFPGFYKDQKDSNDVYLPDKGTLSQRYSNHLGECINNYIELFTVFKGTSFRVAESVTIQHYNPGGGFKKWHCERLSPSTSKRCLVFMTYLTTHNDIFWRRNRGGTSFRYQNINVKAEKGLTLIWPTDFTHLHKSNICYNKEKYIITGWLSFC